MTAKKKNQGKLRWSLVPMWAMTYVVKSLMLGAAKYGDYNWKEGRPFSDYYDATMRHLTRWWMGEDYDEEGQLHLAAAVVNLLFLTTFWLEGRRELDDRTDTENHEGNGEDQEGVGTPAATDPGHDADSGSRPAEERWMYLWS